MEIACSRFYKTQTLSPEDEEIIIDYLYDNNIDVNLDTPPKRLCYLALKHKLGSKEKVQEFRQSLFSYNITEEGEYNLKKYGDMDINSYLNIALYADDRTLLSMMNVSKSHQYKFDDNFFKKYLELHYPQSLMYKPMSKTFKRYYLELIYAIDILKREYNFDYTQSNDQDILQIYLDVTRLNKTLPMYVKRFLDNKSL
jgi:hypothetical protein